MVCQRGSGYKDIIFFFFFVSTVGGKRFSELSFSKLFTLDVHKPYKERLQNKKERYRGVRGPHFRLTSPPRVVEKVGKGTPKVFCHDSSLGPIGETDVSLRR